MSIKTTPPVRKKTCYVFLSESYADWEIGLMMAGLHSSRAVEVLTFALTKDPVCSMGNLAVIPDLSLDEVDPADVDLLVLTGSPVWEKGENETLSGLIGHLLQLHISIAAIADSTLFMACYHADRAVVRDGHFITAGGPYPFQFARKIFKYFGLLDNEQFVEWYQQFQPRTTASLLPKLIHPIPPLSGNSLYLGASLLQKL
jgi:putative intracellular protease/amidase